MKEKPIIFSGEMVRAILDGRKTQTRRAVKFPKSFTPGAEDPFNVSLREDGWDGPGYYAHFSEYPDEGSCHIKSPYGQPGDRLWVRETWGVVTKGFGFNAYEEYAYKANYADDNCPCGKWRPSIHMPRGASRITLEVTGVRVERLQDISEEDAQAEGVHEDLTVRLGDCLDLPLKCTTCERCRAAVGKPCPDVSNRVIFSKLWDSLNAKRGFGWDVNPWVWVVEFKRIKPEGI